jgi:hypothetical protein
MGTRQKLIDRFNAAVAAFNAAAGERGSNQPTRIADEFGLFLNDDAVVYSKQEPHGSHPKAAALAFLQTECIDHPRFDAINPTYQVGPNGAPGTVATSTEKLIGTTTLTEIGAQDRTTCCSVSPSFA